MSRKSVVITLPARGSPDRAEETREAENWVKAAASDPALAPLKGPAIIDLAEDRNPVELAWLLWTFPARATWYWMAKLSGHPRPR